MPARELPIEPDWLSARNSARPVGVDRENKIVRGFVVAQLGPFKTPGRGEFDEKSLLKIRELMQAAPAGLKSRFAHPSLSSDGLGKYLGRARNPSMDSATIQRDGKTLTVPAVRADLHLDQSSFSTPSGNLGGYVLDLAANDPDAISSSLVLRVEKEWRLDAKGKPARDEATGEELPPLWRPTHLHASDIVEQGDAVDGLLSAGLDLDEMPDAIVRRASVMLGELFPGQPRAVVEARVLSWLGRYLDLRYGPDPKADLRLRKARLDLTRAKLS